MIIIFIYIVILFFLRLVFLHQNKLFVLLSLFLLFIIASLRDPLFGEDTYRYVERYTAYSQMGFLEFWNTYILYNGKDPMFYVTSQLFSMVGFDGQMWLAVLSGVFLWSVYTLIKRDSRDSFISIIALVSLGFFYFSLTGLRQGVAISFILLSFPYLVKRKFLQFSLIVFVASMFHSSALIFFIAYPLSTIKVKYMYFVALLALFIISIFYSSQVRNLIDTIGWTENLSAYSNWSDTLNYSGLVIQLSIFIFCYSNRNELIKAEKSNLILINLLFIGVVFQIFSSVIAEFFRVSMFFSIFSIILIPNSIISIRDRSFRFLAYITVSFLLIIYIYVSSFFLDFQFFF